MTKAINLGKFLLMFLAFCLAVTAAACGPQATPTSEPKVTEKAATPAPQAKTPGGTVTPAPPAKATEKPPAATEKPFYAGKIVNLIVSTSAGGAYDTYSRILARHMPRFIPGNPTIVVQNRSGSKVVTANYIFGIAKPDGLTFSMAAAGLFNSELSGEEGVNYKFADFTWIGNMNSKAQILYTKGSLGIKTPKDLQAYKGPPLRNGYPDKSAGAYTSALLIEKILGIEFKYVFGFSGSSARHLAMEQNILDASSDALDTMLASRPNWIKDGYVNLVLQCGIKRHATAPDIPALGEFAANDMDKAMVQLADMAQIMGRPLQAPPGIPADRVAILRKAFVDTLKDPQFLAEAQKNGMPIDIIDGEEMQKMARDVMAVNPTTKANYLKLFQ